MVAICTLQKVNDMKDLLTPPIQMTNAPLVVSWCVMDTCNLACSFCAYDKRLAFPRSVAFSAELSRMIKLFAEFQNSSGRKVLLSWLGAEL